MTEAPSSAAPRYNPNVEALRQAYARWSETKGGSAAEVLELFADRVEMHSVLSDEVRSGVAGVHRTRQEAAEYFEALAREWEMIYYEADRFIADGDDVVMVGRCAWRNRETGKAVETAKCDIWHFENGKATSFSEFYDTLGFATAFGAAQLL